MTSIALPGGACSLRRAGALSVACAVASVLLATGGARGPAPASRPGLASLPAAARPLVSAALGRELPAYRVAGLRARNPAQRLGVRFSPAGATIAAGRVRLGIALTALGYGSALRHVRAVAPRVHGNRVSYAYGPLTAWWENGPLGLEQGFDIPARPGVGDGPLTLTLALSGARVTQLRRGSARLSGPGTALAYRGLAAADARGRAVRAWLAPWRGGLEIRVDDRGAAYPLRIDPFVQEAQLTVRHAARNDLFGYAVAVAGDTIVVGAPGRGVRRHANQGAALVFVRPPSGWTGARTQTATLTASDGGAGDGFGYSVAISGDTVVVGAPGLLYGQTKKAGAAYVFTRPPSGWAGAHTQTARLTASDGVRNDQLGYSVAVSGGTIVAGAPNHRVRGRIEAGAAYVFTRPRSGWSQARTQTGTLTVATPAARAYFGWSVAVTPKAIAAGAQGLHGHKGAAYVFVRPRSGWRGAHTQTSILPAPRGSSTFGYWVAMSADTVVVGAPGLFTGRGAVYVYVEPGTGWPRSLTPAATLFAPDRRTADTCGLAGDGVPGTSFALTVAISGDTIAVGEGGHGTNRVAYSTVCVFTKPPGGWAGQLTQAVTLTPPSGSRLLTEEFGRAVALDGDTLAVGNDSHTVGGREAGAAYVY